MMRHVYSIVRYVPNTANGERVNIGVLAGSEATGEWALQAVAQRSRARRLGGSAKTRAAVFEYLKRLAADLDACSARGERPSEGCSEAWLRDLADRQLGVVQFSQPLPLEADSTESAIAMLWPDLIVGATAEPRAAASRLPPTHNKRTATSSVRRAFREAGIAAENLWAGAQLDADGYSAPVDFAVHDGSAAFLANCWSFRNQRKSRLLTGIQAWAWAVRSLRSNGGALSIGDGDGGGEAPKDIGLAVVYVPPLSVDDEEAFETAMGAFGDPDVKADLIVPYTEASEIAGSALAALRAVGGRAP